PLAGQLVVFTGKLSSLGRRDARALVMRLGGATADDVSARTTMLVVGSEGFGPPPEAASENEAGGSGPANAQDPPSVLVSDAAANIARTSNKLKRAEELN